MRWLAHAQPIQPCCGSGLDRDAFNYMHKKMAASAAKERFERLAAGHIHKAHHLHVIVQTEIVTPRFACDGA